jgi:hypothetical protein
LELVILPSAVSAPQDIAVALLPGDVVYFRYDVIDMTVSRIVYVIQIEWTEIGTEVP